MNKKITLQLFFLFLSIQSLTAINIVKVCVQTQLDESVGQVEFTTFGTSATQIDNDANGCYQFEVEETSGTLTLTPSKNINPANGIDVADLFAMRNHILDISSMSPFQVLASDVNSSADPQGANVAIMGGLTTFDLVIFSRLILSDPLPTSPNIVPSWIFCEPELNSSGTPIKIDHIQLPTPLNGDIQIDILGLKTGDVIFSADPSMFTTEVADDRSGDLVFRTQEQSRTAGEIFDVQFTSDNFENIIGNQFTIEFDADNLEFQEVIAVEYASTSSPGNFLSSNELSNINNGIVNTLWYSYDGGDNSFEIDEVLFQMTFKAKTDLQLSDVLNFNSSSTFEVAYDLDENKMGIELVFDESTPSDDLLKGEIKFQPNFPNPFQTATQFVYTLEEATNVKLEITDATGRVVETLVNESQTAGEHQVVFTPNNLAHGIYFSKLIVGKNTLIQRIIYMP